MRSESFFENEIEAFAYLGSLAIRWEFETRMFADKFDVPTTKITKDPIEGERLKNVRLDSVIKGLREKMPHLNLNIELLKELRDKLVHANFIEFTRILERYSDRSLKSNVVKMDMSTGKIQHADEIKEAKDLLKLKSFGAFIATFNVDTFEIGKQIFTEALDILSHLLNLKAHSYEFDYFSHAFAHGRPFEREEIELFQKFQIGKQKIGNINGEIYLKEFNKLIKK